MNSSNQKDTSGFEEDLKKINRPIHTLYALILSLSAVITIYIISL